MAHTIDKPPVKLTIRQLEGLQWLNKNVETFIFQADYVHRGSLKVLEKNKLIIEKKLRYFVTVKGKKTLQYYEQQLK